MKTHVRYAQVKGFLSTLSAPYRWMITCFIATSVIGYWLFWWYLPLVTEMNLLHASTAQYSKEDALVVIYQNELNTLDATKPQEMHQSTKKKLYDSYLQRLISCAQNNNLQLHECSVDQSAKLSDSRRYVWSVEGSNDDILTYLQTLLGADTPAALEKLTLNRISPERSQAQGVVTLT